MFGFVIPSHVASLVFISVHVIKYLYTFLPPLGEDEKILDFQIRQTWFKSQFQVNYTMLEKFLKFSTCKVGMHTFIKSVLNANYASLRVLGILGRMTGRQNKQVRNYSHMTNAVTHTGATEAWRKEGLTLPKPFEEGFTEEVIFKLSPEVKWEHARMLHVRKCESTGGRRQRTISTTDPYRALGKL